MNKGCDGGDPLGCYVLERAIYRRITDEGDKNTRRALLKKAEDARQAACRAKNKFYACSLWAKMNWTADHTDRRYGGDPELQNDDDAGASGGGSSSSKTADAGVDVEAAERCSGGDYHACFQAGASDKLWPGFQKPCADGDYRACNIILPLGDLGKLCRGGDCEACFELGREEDAKTDKYKADFQAACELGCLEGCAAFVEHAPKKDLATTANRRLFACDRHLASACLEIATSGDPTKDAQLLLMRACPDPPRYVSGGDFSSKACRLLGDFLVHSMPADAEKMYHRACYADVPSFSACKRLGELAEAKKDNAKALVYYAASCLPDESSRPHDAESCAKVRDLASASLPYPQRVPVVERINKMIGTDGGSSSR